MDNPFERALKDFGTKPESPNPETEIEKGSQPNEEAALTVKNKQELMDIFGLTRQLFDFAADNDLGDMAGFRYSDTNNEYEDNPYAKELPQKFYPIIAEYPGKYFVVSYENRSSAYYAKGTRMRFVKLSTVPKKSQTDEKIREIDISEPDPSEGLGNVQFLSVTDSVMEKGFADINTASEGEVDKPHGRAKIKYELGPTGEKRMIESEFDRLDEGIFEWNGADTPVRWVRTLDIEKQGTDAMETTYKDLYIIGRHHQSEAQKDTRVQVNINTVGKLDNPQSITVSFGLNTGIKGKVLYEDPKNNIQVLMNDASWTTPEEVIEILKNDPNYSFIFEGEIDKARLVELIRQKADLISNDWDKTSTIFGSNALEEGKKVIE